MNVVALCVATVVLFYMSGGSVWPGTIAHWVTVAIWQHVCGGERLLLRQDMARSPRPPFWLQRTLFNLAIGGSWGVLFVCYITSIASHHVHGLPMISTLALVSPEREVMQFGGILVAMVFVTARSVLAFRRPLGQVPPRLDACGILAPLACATCLAMESCVEGRGLRKFLLLFKEPECTVHVVAAVVFFVTAVMDMAVVRCLGPPAPSPCTAKLRDLTLKVSVGVMIVQPILRMAQIEVNPWCAIGEWMLFICVTAHLFSLRDDHPEDYDAAATATPPLVEESACTSSLTSSDILSGADSEETESTFQRE